MKKVILSVAAIALVLFMAEVGMSEENKISPAEVKAMIAPLASTIEAVKQAKPLTREQLINENITFLRGKLAGTKNLTKPQKEELIMVFINNYIERVNLSDKQHMNNVSFFQRLADHPKFKFEQKVQILKDHLGRIKKSMERQPLKGKPKGKK